MVLEKSLESPFDYKVIKPANSKGNQPWIFIGRTGGEAEAPILWPPVVKRGLIGKDPDARKDWRQKREGTTEDEIIGGHHWLNGHEFEQTQGDGEGRGSLACCSPWGHKELDFSDWTTATAIWQRNLSLDLSFFQIKAWHTNPQFCQKFIWLPLI